MANMAPKKVRKNQGRVLGDEFSVISLEHSSPL